jgi:hypothetical protein
LKMLYTDDIRNVLQRDKRTTDLFKGVYAYDKLPSRATASSVYVCNTDPSTEPGEHWIVIYFDDKGRAEYFDSFGLHPSISNFEMFLNNNSSIWKCNTKIVQHPFSDACGYHCIFFVVHRCVGFDMNAIVNMYTNDLMFNDRLVKMFVCENLM